VDSALGEGPVRLQWNGLLANGQPPARGVYRVIVEASAGRDSYAASIPLRIDPGAGGGRREILTIGTGAALVGLLATIKKPAPVPARANILYNSLVREQLAKRNAEIAAENAARRRQVKLAIVPQFRIGRKS
jgi:hypothetical protein